MAVKDVVAIGEDAASVLLYIIGICFPPALAFIAIAKVVLPLIGAVAPIIIAAIEKGERPFAAASAAHPGLGTQIASLAARIPVDIKLSSSIYHLDNVTMMLLAKVTPGFSVPGWTDQETQAWMDRMGGPSDSQQGSG